jgi:cephalosporin hydroxylase
MALNLIRLQKTNEMLNVVFEYVPSIMGETDKIDVSDCDVNEMIKKLEPLNHTIEVILDSNKTMTEILMLRTQYQSQNE